MCCLYYFPAWLDRILAKRLGMPKFMSYIDGVANGRFFCCKDRKLAPMEWPRYVIRSLTINGPAKVPKEDLVSCIHHVIAVGQLL